MLRRFDGRPVLITGAGRGIGAATARRIAAEGARVLVTDLDGERAEKAVAVAVERFGGLDVLVSNAFACHPDPALVEDETDEAWQRDLDITLNGAFRCVRAAMPHLAAAGGRGAVVNVGSVNGEQDFGNHAYSAAKAGLASLTRTLAGLGAPPAVAGGAPRAGSGSTWSRRARWTRPTGPGAKPPWNGPRPCTRWGAWDGRRTSRRRWRSWHRRMRHGSRA